VSSHYQLRCVAGNFVYVRCPDIITTFDIRDVPVDLVFECEIEVVIEILELSFVVACTFWIIILLN